MSSLRIPAGVWSWRGTTLALVLLLAPLLGALTLAPDGDVVAAASSARHLLVGTALLVAGVFLYLQWRISASDTSGWLAMLLAAAAVPSLALGAFSLTHAGVADRQAGWLLLFQVVLLLAVILAVHLSRRVALRGDPLAVGLVVGLALACVRQVVLVRAPALPTPPGLVRAAVLAALTVVLAAVVLGLAGLPRWVRRRVGAGLLLLGAGAVIGGTAALLAGLLGAGLLASTAATALHRAIEAEKREVAHLHERLMAVEVGQREDRARLHEIDATVAGIASAQKLMHDGVAADRSEALASMLSSEMERLQRLVADRAPSRRRSVDLDDVVGQIVVAHVARGRAVSWEPAGLRATGRGDDVAEVVNVLLENAAVHGGGGPVSVRVEPDATGSGVSVVVSDAGPGVPPQLRDRVFDWGTCRPGSPGQGIGLSVAAGLAHEMGGRLELLATQPGACFALHLPRAAGEVSARDQIARAS